MNAANVDVVLNAIKAHLDATGHGTTTRFRLCLDTGLSEATVKRAIRVIKDSGLLAVEVRKGHSGGYLFGPIQTGQTGQPNGSAGAETGQVNVVMPCLYQTGQAPTETDLTRLDAQTGQQTGQDGAKASWFVCCIWVDEKGEMWTHGKDGLATYMPCDTKDDAMELAEKHSRMFHKDRSQRYGVLPAVDVCERAAGEAGAKVLHYRYGTLRGSQ